MWPKMYVLVREDLPRQYASVQAGHAVAKLVYQWSASSQRTDTRLLEDWVNQSNVLVYLGAKNFDQLAEYAGKLARINIPWVQFIEPDLNDETTAIACILNEEQAKLFADLPLKR